MWESLWRSKIAGIQALDFKSIFNNVRVALTVKYYQYTGCGSQINFEWCESRFGCQKLSVYRLWVSNQSLIIWESLCLLKVVSIFCATSLNLSCWTIASYRIYLKIDFKDFNKYARKTFFYNLKLHFSIRTLMKPCSKAAMAYFISMLLRCNESSIKTNTSPDLIQLVVMRFVFVHEYAISI